MDGQHWLNPKPCTPTSFTPGTREKMEVIRDRYWEGQELFHPDDATAGEDGTEETSGRPLRKDRRHRQ